MTTTTLAPSPTFPPLANEIPPPEKQGFLGWIWVILGLSGAANLAVLGAYLNRRYHGM